MVQLQTSKMFNSMINSIMGSPYVSRIGANVTVGTSNENARRKSTSNSTAYYDEQSSPDISKDISSIISPVKTSRENSMSYDSYDSTNANMSLYLKHNIDAIDLDNPGNQKIAIQYLLNKVQDNEKLLIAVAKENRKLGKEGTSLYDLNDSLAAENVTLKESISVLEDSQRKFALSMDLENLKVALAAGKDIICSNITDEMINLQCSVNYLREWFTTEKEQFEEQFAVEKERMQNELVDEIMDLKETIDDLRTNSKEEKDEICAAMVDDFETLDAAMRKIQGNAVNTAPVTNANATDEKIRNLVDELELVKKKAYWYESSIKTILHENAKERERTQTKIEQLERDITTTNQYNRRENLIIDGIPDKVPQHKLEEICLDIIRKVGFTSVGYYEVVGCHRLRKKKDDVFAPTIIRFINRKIPEFCKKNRWRLQKLRYNNWNLVFREDLCPANEAILTECEKLKNEGLIFSVFTYNGFVKVVRKNRDRPIKLSHIKDVQQLSS